MAVSFPRPEAACGYTQRGGGEVSSGNSRGSILIVD